MVYLKSLNHFSISYQQLTLAEKFNIQVVLNYNLFTFLNLKHFFN
jgi:hypothetical protein